MPGEYTCFPSDYGPLPKFCHDLYYVLSRFVAFTPFTTAYYVSYLPRDCRGKFFNSLKIWHGIHGNRGLSRLPNPFPRVVSRPSRFDHGDLKCGCRGRREHMAYHAWAAHP